LLAENIRAAAQPNRGIAHTPKYSLEAIERLHECETDLDGARITALRDFFALDDVAASVYVVLTDESLRKSWIQMNLKNMGFPGESRLVCCVPSYTSLIMYS
jgi:hypothetical protein